MRSVHALLLLGAALALAACGGGGGSSRAAPAPSTPPPDPTPQVVDTFAYQAASPYADVMRGCTYAGDATLACTLATLPFLGQDIDDPTIDDVMSRVLVSHTWMGDNFRTVLEQLPSDLLLMLRSVTAIVIASDIRPAFYDPQTGAIYLDAEFVWLTEAEEAVVTDEEDFRASFGDVFQFAMPWRYVRDNQRLDVAINPDGSRDVAELVPILGFLLYHELSHAVDFMSPAKMANVSLNWTVEQAITSSSFLSTAWQDAYPLASALLDSLAGVSFLGDTATQAEEALAPDELVDDFTAEGAIQYYAYSTQFEDFATMFETVMMMYHFDYEKDTGITTNTEFSNDGIVSWGQRGRLTDPMSYNRAIAAVQAMYPGNLADVETFLANLPAPIDMTPGITWGENLEIGSQTAGQPREGVDKRVRDDILGRRAIR